MHSHPSRHQQLHNIVEADALLTWKKKVPLLDKQGNAVTSGMVSLQRTSHDRARHSDEEARIVVYEYTDVKQAKWPEADFIVGNPPFIGGKDIRAELGTAMSRPCAKPTNWFPIVRTLSCIGGSGRRACPRRKNSPLWFYHHQQPSPGF